ncbi:lipopolysaccharide biosynthesis protein [Vibrio splendidus]
MLTKYKKNIIIVGLKVISALVSFIFGIIITNKISLSESTAYFYGINAAMMLASLSTLGLKNYILEISGVDNNSDSGVLKKLSSAIVVCIISMFIFSPILLLYFNDDKEIIVVLLLSFSFLLQSLTTSYLYSLKKQNMGIILEIILPYSLLGYLVYFDYIDTYIEISSLLLSIILMCSVFSIFVGKRKYGVIEKINCTDMLNLIKSKKFFNYMLAMIITNLVSYFPTQIGSFFITNQEVAYLLLSIKISSLIRIFYSAILSIIAPKLAMLHRNGEKDKYVSLVKLSTFLLFIYAIISSAFIIVFQDLIIGFYGEGFGQLKEVLWIVVLFQSLFISTGLVGHALMMAGESTALRKALTMNIITMLPIATFLSYSFGLQGVAVGYGILLSGQHFFCSILLNKKLGINILSFKF